MQSFAVRLPLDHGTFRLESVDDLFRAVESHHDFFLPLLRHPTADPDVDFSTPVWKPERSRLAFLVLRAVRRNAGRRIVFAVGIVFEQLTKRRRPTCHRRQGSGTIAPVLRAASLLSPRSGWQEGQGSDMICGESLHLALPGGVELLLVLEKYVLRRSLLLPHVLLEILLPRGARMIRGEVREQIGLAPALHLRQLSVGQAQLLLEQRIELFAGELPKV
eukprot:scaffold128_cov248-Pinguiococcus_pyrenoidosus.AAC.20